MGILKQTLIYALVVLAIVIGLLAGNSLYNEGKIKEHKIEMRKYYKTNGVVA